MDYRRFKDTIYLRLDPGEEIIEQIEKVAKKENIQLAQINGLGALNDFTTGVFDTVEKKFHPIHFEGAYEIVSLTGTVTKQDGEVYLHLHMAAGDKDGHVFGGHLSMAYVSATAEIHLRTQKKNRGMPEPSFLHIHGIIMFQILHKTVLPLP